MTKIVEMNEAAKVYEVGAQSVKALHGVDLTVEAGEFTSIAGPSGSGKTTLLNLVGCLDVPSSGRVVIDGDDISTKSKFN